MKWVNTMITIQTSLSFPVLGSLVAQSMIIQIQIAKPATRSGTNNIANHIARTSYPDRINHLVRPGPGGPAQAWTPAPQIVHHCQFGERRTRYSEVLAVM